MDVICDIQWFFKPTGPKRFVVKEIAFMSVDGRYLDSFVFYTPPKQRHYSSQNAFIRRHVIGLSFQDGDVPIERLEYILENIAQNSTSILVKDVEKRDILKQLIPRYKNIYLLKNFPSLRSDRYDLGARCMYDHPNCALNNVIIMRNYYLKNPNEYI